MRIIAICVLLSLALAACGSNPVKPDVTTVSVKVKEPCITNAPSRPIYRYGKGAKPSDKEMARILASDFEAAEKYGNDWEAAAAGCLMVPEAPAATPGH